MRRLSFILALGALMIGGPMAVAQMTTEEAKQQGKDLGADTRDATSGTILSDGSQTGVPGYGGTDFPSYDYLEDPVGLSAAGEAQRFAEDYQTVTNPYRTRFDPETIDLSASQAIEKDPDTYLGPGTNIGGNTGECEPLPGNGGGDTTYLESCNQGSQPFDEARTCNAQLNIQVEGSRYFEHLCWGFLGDPRQANVAGWCPAFHDAANAQGATCSYAGTRRVGMICLQGQFPNCAEPEPLMADVYNCNKAVAGWLPVEKNTFRIVSEAVDESLCQTATNGATCSLDTEVCVAPNETRNIGGFDITRDCWEWERTYQCQGVNPANDCGELEARPECTFSHDECLSYDEDNVTCNVYDRWYECTLPGGGEPNPPAYVCADDLYCLDGECTQVEREASDEFKDAMTAMQVMGELRDDFDPNNLRIFSGEHLRCTKKLFGISNCCTGKGVPIITPFLCSSEDREVDRKDDAGLCHKVGTYCSKKILGVCITKKQSYCCFGSKLVRILNEQGRAQLGMEWGTPKEPICEGFLIEQFQQLDLSVMDFSEVYAEFVDAAKLPDEIDLSNQIQEKIADYYSANGGI